MARYSWNPTRLFGCLSARDKGHPNLRDKTLDGRIGKRGTRPIPKAFLDRFWEQHAVADPLQRPVTKAVVKYYTEALTKGDYDFDPKDEKYPGILEQQLEAVKDKELSSPESVGDISPDKQWRVVKRIGNGAYGEVYLLEWHPFGTMVCLYFAFITSPVCKFGMYLLTFKY